MLLWHYSCIVHWYLTSVFRHYTNYLIFLGFGASFLFVFANNHYLMPFISLSLDNDECSPVGDCMHICENTPGSYNCKCNADFKVDPDDSKKCIRE